ncbi:MAG: GNAT family N-acetyltransferase [Ardenticatenaceae bacterium]
MNKQNHEYNELPVGQAVPAVEVAAPARKAFEGRFVSLLPLDAERDGDDLFDISHGSTERDQIWTYLSYGPFQDVEAMKRTLAAQAQSTDTLFFAVVEQASGKRMGVVSFLNIVPQMRRLELGHIWYGLEAQRTKINTETIYLMLCETFDQLHYRRAEWKCDSLNARSRAAALRLGFRFEGLFRQHIIYKGRNRDTAWFGMMDHQWPTIKANMERWLYGDEPGLSLRELNGNLEDGV